MVFLNERGQTSIFFLFMLFVVVIILALALSPVLKSFTDDARNVSDDTHVGLDCNNDSISNFDKANCVVQDISLPYFILGLIALAGIILGAKLLVGD